MIVCKMISLFVAMDKKRAIGKQGGLPWRLPADLAYFKEVTSGHPIIMGRKTFESIGRALPKRTNIVITRNAEWLAPSGVEGLVPSVLRVSNLDEALAVAEESDGGEEVFIIGGGEIFKEAISLADRLYVTEVHTEVSGADTFFPEIHDNIWREISRRSFFKDDKNSFDCDFVIYERR